MFHQALLSRLFRTMLTLAMLLSVIAADAAAAERASPVDYWRELLAFFGFLGFVTFIPPNRLMLGVTLTIAGVFMPTISRQPSGTITFRLKALSFSLRGAPRLALLLVGILIVISIYR
jgi:hypothetical protein